MSKQGFSFSRVGAVAWRVMKQITRDRRTLGMIIMMPAIIMLIFGFALGGEVKNVPVVVDNQDAGYSVTGASSDVSVFFGGNITQALQSDDRVKVTQCSFEEGRCGVDNGTCFAALEIPANFSEVLFKRSLGAAATQLANIQVVINTTANASSSQPAQISIPASLTEALTAIEEDQNATLILYIDGTKPLNQASVLAAVQNALQTSFGATSVELDKEYAFGNLEFSGLDVSIPSVIAFVLTFLVLLISLIIITRESTSGVLARLYATPLSAIERLLGYSAGLLVLGIVMAGVILGIGVGVFGAAVQGNLALLFSAMVLYALAHIFMAVFLSNFAKNELQAVQMAPLIALPSMALSGMLIPINAFPEWVQTISKFVPMYYGNQIFEGIMLKGYGIVELGLDFAVIGGIAALFFALAVMTVKDRIPS
ncbi:MAG: ABC transporter permease [Candidatus Bathyarchaeota archaeon]|nr:ABC transporter permease [Candidatus Bathyarchaeota archaeon]